MPLVRFRRGPAATRPTLEEGRPRLDTDFPYGLFVGARNGNMLVAHKSTRVRHVSPDFAGYPRPYYATIMAGVNDADAGDVVLVYPGIYNEKVVAKEGVAIVGMDRDKCIIEYQFNPATDDKTDADFWAFKSDVEGAPIRNMTIRTTDPTDSFEWANGGFATILGSNIVAENVRIQSTFIRCISAAAGDIVRVIGDVSNSFEDTNGGDVAVRAAGAGCSIWIEGNVSSSADTAIHCEYGTTTIIGDVTSTAGKGIIYTSMEGDLCVTGNVTSSAAAAIICGELPTIRLNHGTIKSTYNSSSGHAIGQASNVILNNVILLATHASAKCVSGGGNIVVLGTAVANRDKASNMTVRVGTLIVDPDYVS